MSALHVFFLLLLLVFHVCNSAVYEQVLDSLADGMAFGALEACKECQGQLVFKGDAYYCTGDISSWTKCVFKTTTPVRKDWVIPQVAHLFLTINLHLP